MAVSQTYKNKPHSKYKYTYVDKDDNQKVIINQICTAVKKYYVFLLYLSLVKLKGGSQENLHFIFISLSCNFM